MSAQITKKRLERLTSLIREIERTERRIADLDRIKSKSKRYVTATYKAREALIKYHASLKEESTALISHIDSVSDARLREILMLRYYDGLPWQKIAFEVGEYDESYVRRLHNKYLATLDVKDNPIHTN